jgi:hypothetical protein
VLHTSEPSGTRWSGWAWWKTVELQCLNPRCSSGRGQVKTIASSGLPAPSRKLPAAQLRPHIHSLLAKSSAARAAAPMHPLPACPRAPPGSQRQSPQSAQRWPLSWAATPAGPAVPRAAATPRTQSSWVRARWGRRRRLGPSRRSPAGPQSAVGRGLRSLRRGPRKGLVGQVLTRQVSPNARAPPATR